MFAATDAVVVREVGLRDGLQSIERILPTAQKIEWIRDAHAAGQREIEVGSFVPARLLPQLADTAELVAFARTLHGLFVSVLVPNLKGAARALESGADLMLVPLSASHAHSRGEARATAAISDSWAWAFRRGRFAGGSASCDNPVRRMGGAKIRESAPSDRPGVGFGAPSR